LEDFETPDKGFVCRASHVLDNVAVIDPSLHYLDVPLLATNRSNRFERIDSGVTTPVAARGAAFGI